MPRNLVINWNQIPPNGWSLYAFLRIGGWDTSFLSRLVLCRSFIFTHLLPITCTLTKTHWDSFNFAVDVTEMSSFGLRLDVKNHVAMFTRSGKVHNMGSIYVDLYKLVGSGPVTDWYVLSQCILCYHWLSGLFFLWCLWLFADHHNLTLKWHSLISIYVLPSPSMF